MKMKRLSSARMKSGADSLPREVLVEIFSYLSYEDLAKSIQFVCTWWQEVSWEKSLWKKIVYETCASSEDVIRMLKISPQLEALSLISRRVDYNLFHYITNSCPNIKQLHMPWYSICNYDEVKITRPMNQIKILSLCFTEFFMNFSYLDSIFPNLESLNMSRLTFESEDLVPYLKKKRDSLHTLSISCRTDDVTCVLRYLSECTKLRKLSLEGECRDVGSLSCKEVEYLRNISHLTLRDYNMSNLSDSSAVFCSFPNIIELELYGCIEASENILHIIAHNCRQLQKLKLSYYYNHWHGKRSLLRNATLKHALHLERLTHLYIHRNSFVTDEGIKHLLLIPKLIHLDLYACDLVTPACLKLICTDSKLEVLKFDLRNKPLPADFRADDVKNKNLLLMLYNCRDVSSLDSLKQQHLRVCPTSIAVKRIKCYDCFCDWRVS